MAEKKKRSRRKNKHQSLAINILLFFLSIGVLAGSTVLFNRAFNSPDVPIKLDRGRKTIDVKPKETNRAAKDANRKAYQAAVNYNYSFYEILLNQEKSAANSKYCIQIAAFRSKKSAKRLIAELKTKHLHPALRRHGRWYLVQWGSFPTEKSAERYREKLSKLLGRKCILVKIS